MQTLVGNYDDRAASQPAVGLIVLQSDVVMEHELRTWLPARIRLLHSRIPNSTYVSADTLCAMEQDLPAATRLLPATIDYAAVAYGCTSASTLIGEARVRELIQAELPGVSVTNPITALKARLEALGLARIALLTPYSPVVSSAIVDHLDASGIEVVQVATFNETYDDRVARISERSVLDAMIRLGRQARCEAVFGSCTNLRALSILNEAQARTGKPVITSNSALAWHVEQLASE